MRYTSLIPLTILCLGCGDPKSPDSDGDADADTVVDCSDGPITIDAGTGYQSYIPLENGDEVVIIYGAQGGWHIDVGGSVVGSAPEVAAVQVSAVITLVAEDMIISGADEENLGIHGLSAYDAETCTGQLFGLQALVNDYITDTAVENADQQFICSLAGKDLELVVTIADPVTGQTSTDTKIVKAKPDPVSNNCN